MSVLYLTGVAATGKSSVAEGILQELSSLKIIRYSDLISEYLLKKCGTKYTNEELREQSSYIIKPEDIYHIDVSLVDFVKNNSVDQHIIIESHAVTTEEYGYRVTPFSIEVLKKISPDIIIVLYADPNDIFSRIVSNPSGRRNINSTNIAFGQSLQGAIALQYGMTLNCTTYFIDTSNGVEDAVKWILEKLDKL